MEHWDPLELSLTRAVFPFPGPTRLVDTHSLCFGGRFCTEGFPGDTDEVGALKLVGPLGIFDSVVLPAA